MIPTWWRCSVVLLLGSLPLLAHDGLDEQLAAATAAITHEPQNAGLFLRRAELHRLHGDLLAALADVAQAQTIGTLTSGIDRQRARILMDQRDFAGAFHAYSRHLEDCPNDGDARARRATCAIALNDVATAIVDLDTACRLLHQPDPELLCQLAELLHAVGRTDEAIARLDAAIAHEGPVPAYLERTLAIERSSHRYSAMLVRLEHVFATTGQTRWLVERGDLLLQLGRNEDASACYQRAEQTMASLPPARRLSSANRALIERIDHGLSVATHLSLTTATTRTTAP